MASMENQTLAELRAGLEHHPVYGAVADLGDLRVFMAHHVYSVWDFMSLIKTLQQQVAPVRVPWVPPRHPELAFFINQLVLEEESDQLPEGILPGAPAASSHFALYCHAMEEIGADGGAARNFVARVAADGVESALAGGDVPAPSRAFTATTFDIIHHAGPHGVAAALAHGREQVIPGMFRGILAGMGVGAHEAPAFHFYLNRHIHLDEDFHGPLSLRLVDALVGDDAGRRAEADEVVMRALRARITFWDGVLAAIEARGAVSA